VFNKYIHMWEVLILRLIKFVVGIFLGKFVLHMYGIPRLNNMQRVLSFIIIYFIH